MAGEAGRRLINTAIVAIETVDEVFFACLTAKQRAAYKSVITALIAANGL